MDAIQIGFVHSYSLREVSSAVILDFVKRLIREQVEARKEKAVRFTDDDHGFG